jgi:hypothetical protein
MAPLMWSASRIGHMHINAYPMWGDGERNHGDVI